MNKDQFIERLEAEIQNYITISKANMNWKQKKQLAEFEILLDEVIEYGKLDIVDLVKLKRYSEEIADKLRFDNIIFYYSSFHYFYNHLMHNDPIEGLSKDIYQMNIQINIMRIQIRHGYVTGCSEDDYYFSRGKELIKGLAKLANNGDKGGDYNQFLYLALNYMQSLFEYKHSGDKTYISMVDVLINDTFEVIRVLTSRFNSVKDSLKRNAKLRLFVAKIYYSYYLYKGMPIQSIIEAVQKIDLETGQTDTEWALLSIYEIDTELFKLKMKDEINADYYEKYYEESRIIALRNYLHWLILNEDVKFGLLKLPSNMKSVDNSWFKLDDYFNGYDCSFTTVIDETDKAKVADLNDEQLRKKLAKIIKNIDSNVVERESRKPHGPMEIADMELPIRREKVFSTYYLCIPVKSGREIPNKVSEQIAYQVIRPFTNFGNSAIVVFVSVKEATEGFYNYIKRAQVNLGLDIYIIDGDALVKLLKFNNLLN